MALNLSTRVIRKSSGAPVRVEADIAVLGSGAAGMSAALEAAKLGARVALVDAAPALGGQAVNAIIGTFCGFYSNGPQPYQVTHGIVDDLLRDLGAAGALHARRARNTKILMYSEVALARWLERQVQQAKIDLLLGAVLRGARRTGGRIEALDLATRYGDIELSARGFVDATGDAALCWLAGFDCREPEVPIFGTQMVTLEGFDEAAALALDRAEMQQRLKTRGDAYGLLRRDGFVFAFPGQGTALVNMTHVATPLDPVGASASVLQGRDQADRVLEFLRREYPEAFAKARIRAYGLPGIRQTRWIVGRHHYTIDEVRGGVRQADAIGRCSWPIELHDRADGVHWEEFGDGHMHWIPFGALTPAEADNVVAAGRCIDADPVALSSVRVMGPCIAMGAAAAHALDLAGAGSVRQIDIAALQRRLADNLERCD